MLKKCPLCQGKLLNGECLSCGYKPPDEDDISAIYNYDPSDYPQEEPKMREIAPDPYMEEIYPNKAATPEFKVRDDAGKTVRNDQNAANPYANSGAFKPYQSPQNNNNNNNNANPYANNGNFNPYTSNASDSQTGSLAEFFKKYWVILLIMLLVPRFASFIIGITMLRGLKSEDRKFRLYFVIAIIISVAISLF